ncbi:unnamed protein product [Chrysoparadoxa australica]
MVRKRKAKEDEDYVDEGDDLDDEAAFELELEEDEGDEAYEDDDDKPVMIKTGPKQGKAKKKAAKGKGKRQLNAAGGGVVDAGSRAKMRLDSMNDVGVEEDDEGSFREFKDMVLKADHSQRPIWVCGDCHIFLEATSPFYQQAYDFLVAIAEPVSRPEFVHEYKLTPYSLFAAVAVAIDTESIVSVLGKLSKNVVPREVNRFIRECTERYGKAKLVLKKNQYHVESPYPEILRELLTNPDIDDARVLEGEMEDEEKQEGATGVKPAKREGFDVSEAAQEMDANLGYKDLARAMEGEEGEDLDPDVVLGTAPGARLQSVSFRIQNAAMETVKKAAIDMDLPLMEEYDFRNDAVNPTLKMDLKPNTKIRAYQARLEKSLSKMFGNGRARSGIIVLPCGAGKTLTGVTAASTVKKSVLVLCTSGVSVVQWKYQFQLWTDVAAKDICCFTSDMKDTLPKGACVLITTYSMISFGGKRAADVDLIIQSIKDREWGLMLLDEVHVVPAKMFRKVLGICHAHCKLGLTATLVREDDLISDLNFLIGPKLYEANWMDLTNSGFLANVQCVEAWCPMTAEFMREYLNDAATGGSPVTNRQRELLYILNPNKFRTAEFLVQFHQQRGDKIILFADNVFALQKYATVLGIPYIYGATKETERQRILGLFRIDSLVNVIGLSKVGDTSIDIPEANVIIQVSSHFGSRRQEAQRLGRILRPKANMGEGFNAFFYTLASAVSTDTSEMYYSAKRQQYLVDQGYTFKVVADLVEHANSYSDNSRNSKLRSKQAERALLEAVLNADNEKDEEEGKALDKAMADNIESEGGKGKTKRKSGSMSALSGGAGSRYFEYASNLSNAKKEKVKHNMFKIRNRKKAEPMLP